MENFLLLPFVEIEIRLGTSLKYFDTSVDKKYFNKIKESLNLSKDFFKNSVVTSTVEYINKNLKLISDKKLPHTFLLKGNEKFPITAVPSSPLR
jgi:hypothetical protein